MTKQFVICRLTRHLYIVSDYLDEEEAKRRLLLAVGDNKEYFFLAPSCIAVPPNMLLFRYDVIFNDESRVNV